MLNQFGIFDLPTTDLVLILLIVLLLFGGAKLPELSKSLGSSMREFRKALDGKDEEPASKEAEAKKPKQG